MKFFILSLLLTSTAFAAEPKFNHELKGSTSASFQLVKSKYSFFNDTSSNSLVSVSLGYGYFFSENWELQASLSAEIVTGGGSSRVITPMAGMAYNFNKDSEKSVFILGQIGPEFRHYSNDYTVFAYVVAVGKRIPLVEHVSWSPTVSFSGHSSGSATDSFGDRYYLSSQTVWAITPLQIAVLF